MTTSKEVKAAIRAKPWIASKTGTCTDCTPGRPCLRFSNLVF